MIKSHIPISISVALWTILSFTGCLGLHVGGGTRSTMTTYSTTLGQQLIDLQKAYDAGIITEADYDAQKRKLLRDYGKR